jgi:hypothetical protein
VVERRLNAPSRSRKSAKRRRTISIEFCHSWASPSVTYAKTPRFRSFEHEWVIGCVKERDDRAGCLVDDLLDQLQRVLGAFTEAYERNVRVLARRHRPDLGYLDLRDEHLVPQPGDDCRDIGKTILTLVGDEHPKPFHVHLRAPNSALDAWN